MFICIVCGRSESEHKNILMVAFEWRTFYFMLSKMLVDKNHKELPYLSVIIPCFNARETISQTLDSVCSQNVNFTYEVIVIDSSNDDTDAIIRTRYPQVRLYHLNEQTLPGSGRNLGVNHARGEIVVFTDSDCVPDSDWLSQIVAQYQDKNIESVGGCVINGYPRNIVGWVSHLIEFNEWTPNTHERFVKNIPSCNISYKKEVFTRFKIHFTDIFPSEDTLFNWTLIQKGGRIYFDPRIRVVHLSRVGFRKLFAHQKRLGMASAEARRVSTLKGKIFTKIPVLGIFIPCLRWCRASVGLLCHDPKTLLLFWLLTPVYLLAVTAWTLGFLTKGTFTESRYVIE
jgi:glycosyltransferase involved in cell wall biosynthesis